MGNTEVCSYTVLILDTIPPTLMCPEGIVETIALEDSTFMTGDLSPTILDDACGIATLTFSTTGALDTTGTGALINIDFP